MTRVSKLLLIIGFICLPAFLPAQVASVKSNYLKSVTLERKQKDKEFIEDKDSPLDSISKLHFKGLNYFRVSPKWKINARIELYSNPDTIKMKTTTERLPLYLVYGKAFFLVNDQEFSLTIYRNVGLMSKPGYEDYLFIPFTDETSGKNSYGGGRYIDARIIEGNNIVIDFNKAYNPYCVYSKRYSCPVPPSENYLAIPVTAGEKSYKH